MKARLIWVEGKRAGIPSFIPVLRKKDYQVELVATGSAALERLLTVDPDLVVINAASMRTSGKRICQDLREKMDHLPIVLILGEKQEIAENPCANVVLKLPFTARKLINRIVPLLPGNAQHIIHVGPLRLDIEHKRLRCLGQEARLTPRLVRLLQVLMQHHGEVVERKNLFCEVWNTEYSGDTRTLDVHISWLRAALHDDPRKPTLLKTIRGVGYRLDV
ncbi:MAG: response regulator transcription factor [Anaerolineales bacterium]|nr:response regulator transcription factor [Anaerolineales bacterium]